MSKSYILSRMDWAKAYRDYEELKVGNENLLENSNFKTPVNNILQSAYGTVSFEGGKMVKTATEKNPSNRLEFQLNHKSELSSNEKYTLIIWADVKTYTTWRNFENAEIIKQEVGESFGQGIQPTLVTFKVQDTERMVKIRFYTPDAPIGEKHIIEKVKLSKGSLYLKEKWTPSPSDINASPFTIKLAQDYYHQQEEITELRNAILQLGGQ